MSKSFLDDTDRLDQRLRPIDDAVSLGALRLAARDLLQPYGLKHVVYHAIRIPAREVANEVMLFTYPDDWVSHYVRRKYHLLDPVVRTAASGIMPVDWARLDRSAPAVRKLFGEAGEAGIGRQGLTIPIRGAAGDHALLTVTSDLGDKDWGAVRLTYVRDMQVVATYLHSRIIDILGASPRRDVIRLSNRETETLQWAAAGKTIEDTAIILRLSASTVRVYLDGARHKLGCVSKPHAVGKAVRLGLIAG